VETYLVNLRKPRRPIYLVGGKELVVGDCVDGRKIQQRIIETILILFSSLLVTLKVL
jgi:hypothetical protein